jgi:hypothetical protein
MMVPLAGIAAWCSATGQAAQAISLAAFVEHHWATWHETRQQAAAIQRQASRALPSTEAEAARRRGETITLADVLVMVADMGNQGLGTGEWGFDRSALRQFGQLPAQGSRLSPYR